MGAVHFSIDASLVDLLQQELGIQSFVETGTFQGDTIAELLPRFDSIHSVELSPEYYRAAVERFSGCANVHLHHGDSPNALRKILSEEGTRPRLFWLDAHWCAADSTAGEKSQCPLLEEIRAIGKLDTKSVIMIDDARYFLCAPPAPHEVSDWPALQEVLDALRDCGAETHRVAILNDVILYYPRHLHARITEFANKSGADWLQIASKARTFDEMTDSMAALNDKVAAMRRKIKAAQEEVRRIKKRPLRFLFRCWIGKEKRD